MRGDSFAAVCLLAAGCLGEAPTESRRSAIGECRDVFDEEQGWHRECEACAPGEQIFTEEDGWHCPAEPGPAPACSTDPERCHNLCDAAADRCNNQCWGRDYNCRSHCRYSCGGSWRCIDECEASCNTPCTCADTDAQCHESCDNACG
jgi:hypothetical protein